MRDFVVIYDARELQLRGVEVRIASRSMRERRVKERDNQPLGHALAASSELTGNMRQLPRCMCLRS